MKAIKVQPIKNVVAQYKCANCNKTVKDGRIDMLGFNFKYCPNCGEKVEY